MENHDPHSSSTSFRTQRGTVSMSALLSETLSQDEGDTVRDVDPKFISQASGNNSPQRSDLSVFELSKLSDTELRHLQSALHQILQMYLNRCRKPLEAESVPFVPPSKKSKKHKSGRHRQSHAALQKEKKENARLERHQLLEQALEELDICIEQLHERAKSANFSLNVMEEALKICLDAFKYLGAHDPVSQFVIKRKVEAGVGIAYDATLERIAGHAVYHRLARALTTLCWVCTLDHTRTQMWHLLRNWISARSNAYGDAALASDWDWMFALMSKVDPVAVLEFLLEAVLCGNDQAFFGQKLTLCALIEYIASEEPMILLSSMECVLHKLVDPVVCDYQPRKFWNFALKNMLLLIDELPIVSRIIDTHFDCLVSVEWMQSLFETCVSEAAGYEANNELVECLLQCVSRFRYKEFNSFSLSLVLLIDDLVHKSSDIKLSRAALQFQQALLDHCRSALKEAKSVPLIDSLASHIPYLCKRLMDTLHFSENNPPIENTYKSWLLVLGTYKLELGVEVVNQLMEMEKSAFSLGQCVDPVSHRSVQWIEFAFALFQPFSEEFTKLIERFQNAMRNASDREMRKRFLCSVRAVLPSQISMLLSEATKYTGLFKNDSSLPVIQQSWNSLYTLASRWRSCCGIQLWDTLLEYAESDLAFEALQVLQIIPQPSSEDAQAQLYPVYRLIKTFAYLLQQYRVAVLASEGKDEASRDLEIFEQCQSRFLRATFLHASPSAFIMYATTWLDFVLSPNSPCSVPSFADRVFPANSQAESSLVNENVMRLERSVSHKCLQTAYQCKSNTIPPDAPEQGWSYLDQTRRLSAAQLCADAAINTLQTHFHQAIFADSATVDRMLQALVETLMERCIPCCGIPGDEVYKDFLPNRSQLSIDVRLENWLLHSPILLPLLQLITNNSLLHHSDQFIKLLPLFKSALVVMIGYWNSVRSGSESDDVPPYMRRQYQLHLTCELVSILHSTGWFPSRLIRSTKQLLPLVSSCDIRSILSSLWMFLSNHPPTFHYKQNSATSSNPFSCPTKRHYIEESNSAEIELYLIPTRQALHRNIHKIGAKYALLKC